MRFLKRKVLRAQGQTLISPLSVKNSTLSSGFEKATVTIPRIKRKIFKSDPYPTSKGLPLSKPSYDVKSTKNIVKNYGRAITSFALSSLGFPYLEEILRRDFPGIDLAKFTSYISERRDTLDCMERLKKFLLVSENDSEEEVSFKEIYKKLGEIFIKYFSVNWIFNGKLTYTQAHLDFRFKMLRRLKNPELFTYLRSFQKHI
jgi:hypothetical protein